jgi:hypothetical protein
MSGTRRDKFLKRISTVGGGTRDDIQMVLGGIVYDIRDMVERGMFSDEELDVVVPFHDQVEEFWRHTMVSNPPMDPFLMASGLRRLRGACVGPVHGFQLRLDQAVEKATSFATSGQHGRRKE